MSAAATLTEEFVIEEVRKLQHLYTLKRTIRYANTRSETDNTESVAEHIYGMHVLAHYFLPLENPERTWDQAAIFSMITWHDIDEIETGDTIGYLKTEIAHQTEHQAYARVLSTTSPHLVSVIQPHLAEYTSRSTPEARFAYALDKFEPLIHLYNPAGKAICNYHKTTRLQANQKKYEAAADFPTIARFTDVLLNRMDAEGFFTISP